MPVDQTPINVSVVIPVYRGEDTLPAIAQEIAELHIPTHTPAGRKFRVTELLLVWDHGPGASDRVIRQLAREHSFIRPIWLSRNFGQHAATLAGMTSSSGEWIITMDEDGQHDPAFIGAMLDSALNARAQLVYGAPTNPPPHGAFRNLASKITKSCQRGIPRVQLLSPRSGRGGTQRGSVHRNGGVSRCRFELGGFRHDHVSRCSAQ
jgi:undecaprenyl-phosphate 4-deoxy-4-formamido-L-arabinose transferase